jgi:hypothetical protein
MLPSLSVESDQASSVWKVNVMALILERRETNFRELLLAFLAFNFNRGGFARMSFVILRIVNLIYLTAFQERRNINLKSFDFDDSSLPTQANCLFLTITAHIWM